jgi:hypothetical protein
MPPPPSTRSVGPPPERVTGTTHMARRYDGGGRFPPRWHDVMGIRTPGPQHQARRVGFQQWIGMVGGGSQFSSFLREGGGQPPLAPPTGRQHLHRHVIRSAAKAVSGGSFADRSDAPLLGEESYDMWWRLRLGDVRWRRPFEVASGLPSWADWTPFLGRVRSVRLCSWCPPPMGAGCVASSSAGWQLPLRRPGQRHLGGGRKRAGGGAVVLVGTDGGCLSWCRTTPCSAADEPFGCYGRCR